MLGYYYSDVTSTKQEQKSFLIATEQHSKATKSRHSKNGNGVETEIWRFYKFGDAVSVAVSAS